MKKKWIKRFGLALGSLVLAMGLVVGTVWNNEISTLWSIKEIMKEDRAHQDGRVLTMAVKGDYYLDDLLQQGGVKSDPELINFCTNKITKGLFKLSIKKSKIACSSYTAEGANGDRYFARNYDMKRTHLAIVTTKPAHRYASVSTVDLSFLGIKADDNPHQLGKKINMLAAAYTPLDGVNEKGLSVGIYMTYQGPGDKGNIATDQATAKPDITSTVLLRLMLDKAATVDQAIALAKQYDMHDSASSSFHYMVADATGKSAVLEYLGDKDQTDTDPQKRQLVVHYNDPKASQKGQVVTNFVLQPGYYDQDKDKKGLDRYQLLTQALEKQDYTLANEGAAMDLLSQVGRRRWKNDDQNTITTHSVIYNLTRKTSYWVANEHYKDSSYSYHFKFASLH